MFSAYQPRCPDILEQRLLGDVGRVHEQVPGLLVPPARVLLHHPADDAALGVEDGQAGADLVREREQVELDPEPAVVPLLDLLEQVEVLGEGVLGLPGGAVDPLELRVLLAPPPVRARRPQQLEGRDGPGGRDVRPAAQVAPAALTAARVEVVVDGQRAVPDLDGLLLAGPAPLVDDLQLVGLVLQLGPGLVVADDPPGEALPLLDDLAHALLDPVQVLGNERLLDVEVVVEAVLDRRPDAQLRLREQVLDGLGEHVRGRVAHDHPAVVAGQGHRFDLVALLDDMPEVPQHPVDPGRHHRLGLVPAVALALALVEQVPGGRARVHRPLVPIDLDGDAQVGHLCS